MHVVPVSSPTPSGETVTPIKYLPGSPRKLRFDAKQGLFNVDGKEPLGRSLTFQPMAWEFFEGDILGMGLKKWVEFFFLDEKNRLCTILFHGNSVNALKQVSVPLFYDSCTLDEVVLTVTPAKRENTKIQPKGIYYIAEFSYVLADPEQTAELARLAQSLTIYREDTINDSRVGSISHGYRVPESIITRVFGLATPPADGTAIDQASDPGDL